MVRMISLVGVVGHLAFSLPAMADVAAWCAVINYGEYWDCQYRSFEDCYHRGMILAGNRGFCNASPYYTESAQQRQTRRRYARPY